jgi:hypothetical protein
MKSANAILLAGMAAGFAAATLVKGSKLLAKLCVLSDQFFNQHLAIW